MSGLDPSIGAPLDAAALKIVEEFQRCWESGRPEIEEHLERHPERPVRLLMELAAIDLENRLKRGEQARIAGYTVRFPQLAGDVACVVELKKIAARCLARRDGADFGEADRDAATPPGERWPGRAGERRGGDPLVGSDIGGVTIVRLIAQGGMGRVYEGRQQKPRRPVAVKVMRPGIASPSLLKRFEYEAQVLARLRHPGIAQIHTVGTHVIDDQEVPYFVMEYVPNAKPLTQHAVDKKLSTHERLELFRRVCEAVAHGHQKGVIHRDLKPGNVLVDSSGQPKVIDFGLARSTDSDLALTTMQTDVGALVGTLQYMSPEQFDADPHDLDVRLDVYALGVMLYELLTGKPPYDIKRRAIFEVARVVREEEPTPLSSLDRTLRRDVAIIAAKCLQKDRNRRYSSATELAGDVSRYLAGEPITAAPPSFFDAVTRLARKHKAAAAAVAGVAMSLVVAVIGISAFAIRAERARVEAGAQKDLATAREREARSIAAFYEDNVLALARPKGWFGGAGREVTLKSALDMAGPRIEPAFAGQPLLEAAMHNKLGETYYFLADYEAANSHLERALALRKAHLGDDHPDTLTSEFDLSNVRWKQSRLEEAISLARGALDGRRRVLGPEHADTLLAQLNLGLFLDEFGDEAEAETLLTSGVEACRRVLGPDHHHTLYGQNDLAVLLAWTGRRHESIALDRRTLEGRRRSLGADHPDTLRSMDNLAWGLQEVGQLEEAENLCREGLELRIAVLGRSHNETFWSMTTLAYILEKKGEIAAADRVFREALGIAETDLGPDAPDTIKNLAFLGRFLQRQQSYEEALAVFREAVDRCRRSLPPESLLTLLQLTRLANVLTDRGDFAEAEAMYRDVLGTRTRKLGGRHPDTLITRNNLARLFRDRGEFAAATAEFTQILDMRRRLHGDDHPDTILAESNLALTLAATGHWDEAERLLRGVIVKKGRQLSDDHVDVLEQRGHLADISVRRGDLEAARATAAEILEASHSSLGEDNPFSIRCQVALADILRQMGRLADAESLLRTAVDRRRRLYPVGHRLILAAELDLANVLAGQDGMDEADRLFADVVAACRTQFGDDNLVTADALVTYGTQLTNHGRLAAAESMLREGLAVREARLPTDHWRVAAARSILGHCLAQLGRDDEGKELQATACSQLRITAGASREAVCQAFDRLQELYDRTGRPDLAAQATNDRLVALAGR